MKMSTFQKSQTIRWSTNTPQRAKIIEKTTLGKLDCDKMRKVTEVIQSSIITNYERS